MSRLALVRLLILQIKGKEKKKKRNINNDLAILPSHDKESSQTHYLSWELGDQLFLTRLLPEPNQVDL